MVAFLRYNLIGILWILFIFIACTLPGSSLPEAPFLSFDKLFHAGVFFILVFFLARGLKKQNYFPLLHRLPGKSAAVFGVFYGLALEIIQGLFVANRTADPLDMVANTAGCLLGLFAFYFVFYMVKPKKDRQ